MSPRRIQWLLYGPLLAFGLFLIVWRVIWNAGAELMRTSLAEFAEMETARGGAVSYAPIKTQGFPFYLRGTAENFSATMNGSLYECGLLNMDALPYAPDRIIFTCGGQQSLRHGDEVWSINARDGRASIERDADRGWLAKVDTGKASLHNEGARISVADAIINFSPNKVEQGVIDASLRIIGLDAGPPDHGYKIERIDAAASIDSAERVVRFHGLDAVSGKTRLRLEGSLRLDAGEPPSALFDVRLEQPVGLVRILAAAGILDDREVKAVEAGVALLSVAAGGAISAPVEIKGGEISLAGQRIARLNSSHQP